LAIWVAFEAEFSFSAIVDREEVHSVQKVEETVSLPVMITLKNGS
jgi:hypothetical protein